MFVQTHNVIEKRQQLTDFHDTLMALSTPGSKRYGEWLTHAEVAEKLAPSHESMDAVLGFCVEELGARDVHVNKHRSVVSVVVPARVAEAALSTRLHHHSHAVYSMVDVVRAVPTHRRDRAQQQDKTTRKKRMFFGEEKTFLWLCATKKTQRSARLLS